MRLLLYKEYITRIMHLHYEKSGKGIIEILKANTNTRKGGFCVDKNELYKVAGAKLREFRKATGASIFKVGRAINVSGNYISQIERGDRPASDAVLVGLAELYGVEQKELFGLYGKLPDDEVNVIMQMPELRNLFTEVTSKKDISDEDHKAMIEEFKEIAKKYYNKDGD